MSGFLTYIGVVGLRGILPNIDNLVDEYNIDLANTCFVSGACKNSPDESIANYCRENKLPIVEYPPNWKQFPKEQYGYSAFHYRNEQIVLTSDRIFIYHNGFSKGAEDVIKLCRKHNKKFTIIKDH